MQTAAAARRFGFAARCVLYGAPPDHPTGNLVLHRLLETPIRWVTMVEGETRHEQALRRGLAEEAEAVKAAGGTPYSIPTGGSTAVGAVGYARAMQETKAQLEAQGVGDVEAVFFASGSGGTQAGMIVGARYAAWQTRLVGVEIEPIPPDADGINAFHRAVHRLTNETAERLGLPADFTLADITLCPDFAGKAYGLPTAEGQEAVRLLAQSEGILLDPVYTGKAMAALIGGIRAGRFRPDQTVLFWHTGGVGTSSPDTDAACSLPYLRRVPGPTAQQIAALLKRDYRQKREGVQAKPLTAAFTHQRNGFEMNFMERGP